MSWRISQSGHDPARLGALESILAVGNGYVGVARRARGGHPGHDAGMVLNGFYESWAIQYPEDAYGLARTGQTTEPPPDGSVVRLFVDDEPFDLATARVLRNERVLDTRARPRFIRGK